MRNLPFATAASGCILRYHGQHPDHAYMQCKDHDESESAETDDRLTFTMIAVIVLFLWQNGFFFTEGAAYFCTPSHV
jgi:hypothetical protein